MVKLFGTDGIRGVANKYPITAEVALGLGKAFVTAISKSEPNKKIKIVVGRDTRISGNMLEESLIAGINAAGADVLPLEVIPSNAVSYFIGLHDCEGGVMISASHNPADENGMKFFSGKGFKLSETEEEKLEEIFFSRKYVQAEPGTIYRVRDVKQGYISMVADSLRGADLEGLRIGIDAGNGAASYIIKDLFHELKATAEIINNEPDGHNINAGGALSPGQLQELVKDKKLNAGVAFDGDADRLVMVDEHGNVLDGDTLIAIAALSLNRNGRLKGSTIVVTDYSNMGLDRSLDEHGIKVVRVQNGDKYVSQALFQDGYSLGGENSGHIIYSQFAKTADALVAAAQILALMKEQGSPLSELSTVIQTFPQIIINVDVVERRNLDEMQAVKTKIMEAENALQPNGRVFVRYSGTEMKMRILVEGQNKNEIQKYANSIAAEVQSAIGAQ